MSSDDDRRGVTGRRKGVAPSPIDYFEERRKYPRIVIDAPVRMTFGRNVLDGLVHDVSPDGLQVRCDRKTMQRIHPSGRAIKGESGPLFSAAFQLPIGSDDKRFDAEARLYYFVLLPGEKGLDVAFGARFTGVSPANQEVLDAFIRDALQPVEDVIVTLLSQPRSAAELADRLRTTPERVVDILTRIRGSEYVIEMNDGATVRYVQLPAALRLLFGRMAALDRRLQDMEERLRKS
jgi:hypothetical protein